jgi:hypothetical protein
VFYAQLGALPSKLAIWPKAISGKQHWGGMTYGLPERRTDATTSAERDLKTGQGFISGVMAECLFDREYRMGSSLDEIVQAVVAVHNAAVKMQCDPERLWFEACVQLAKILKTKEATVRKIADELMRKWTIKSRRLAYLLTAVKRASHDK